MASVDLHNIEGDVVGEVDLPETVFGIEPNQGALYYAIRGYQTNQRQGNAHTKTRAEVNLTKRKMYRQKGTGRARMGTASSPIRIGGGVAHGPRPRSFRERVPKKVKRLALRSALSLRASEGKVKAAEDISLDAPKTKRVVGLLKAVEAYEARTLLLMGGPDPIVAKSCRNLKATTALPVAQATAYDVLLADTVVLTRSALSQLETLWGKA